VLRVKSILNSYNTELGQDAVFTEGGMYILELGEQLMQRDLWTC